ncbi:MAG: E3 ubiquitin ligase family protein [Nitrospinota bacterium]|nr:E3 ubiquitin ligase family protein [Nitrospinota bacterium]
MTTTSNNEGDLIMGAAFGAVMGVVWFVRGFQELKIKRTIQNIPTSKINTGAVGTDVEIKGNILVEPDLLDMAPISGQSCALYHLEIQQERRRKNSTYWHTIDQFYSREGFYVDDQSGATALVLVNGAKVNREGKTDKYYVNSNNFDEMPDALRNAITENQKKLKRFKLNKTSWLLSSKYRILEWCFQPNEEVYVLGHAESGLRLQKIKKPGMKYFLKARKAIQTDKKLAARFDSNQDGRLDPPELERGAQILAQRLSDKHNGEAVKESTPKTKLIFKKSEPHPFIISNRSEGELVRHMSTWSTVKIWGGPVLTVACAWYLFIALSNLNLI